MQVVQKPKRFLCILLAAVLCIGLLTAIAAPARAVEHFPQELYIAQSRGGVCTLASSTMLVRSTLYMNGSSHWNEVSEGAVGSFAWLSGAGLLYTWTFRSNYAEISVGHTPLSGISSDDLKALVDEHPEGIVFYCIGCPHAVFLTDYEGDTFYCADPAPYVAGKRIPLADSWLGECYGHNQATVLANASAYWSVTSCDVEADMDEIPLEKVKAEVLEKQKEAETEQLIQEVNELVGPAQTNTVSKAAAYWPAAECAANTDAPQTASETLTTSLKALVASEQMKITSLVYTMNG